MLSRHCRVHSSARHAAMAELWLAISYIHPPTAKFLNPFEKPGMLKPLHALEEESKDEGMPCHLGDRGVGRSSNAVQGRTSGLPVFGRGLQKTDSPKHSSAGFRVFAPAQLPS